MGSRDRAQSGAEEAVLRLVQEHAAELLRFARRFSHCPDDAHDAYQRSLEILVRRMRVDPPAQPLSWLRTVLRHEALLVRAQRDRLVARDEVDFDCHEGRHLEDPAERAIGQERLRHAAEALQRLKPQEVTALVLRAEGLSYKEIAARTGWSYTRCNRAITEGRRAFVDRLGAIESGAECERWLPLLSALADGEASRADLAELRPHLRTCTACRATLRGFADAPAQVAALVPVAVVPLVASDGGSLLEHAGAALHGLAERVSLVALRAHGALEGASGTKFAAVAASTAALAGGGAAIEHAVRTDGREAGGATQASVSAPAATAPTAPLLTISDPLSGRTAAGARPRRSERRGGEFATPPTREPEFRPRPTAPSEFASSTAPAMPSPPAATASAPPARASPSPPAEFAGP